MIYQSYWTILGPTLSDRRKKGLTAPPHDYLDDLECFLYVTCHIMHAFERPGVWVAQLGAGMMQWMDGDLRTVAGMKRLFCEDLKRRGPDISDWWGDHCATLLEEFGQVVFDIQEKKKDIFENARSTAEAKRDAQMEFAKATAHHYELVVNAFRKAIAGLEKEGLAAEERVIYNLSASPTKCLHFPLSNVVRKLPFEYRLPLDLSLPTSVKRSSQDDDEDAMPSKRNRQGPSPLSSATANGS